MKSTYLTIDRQSCVGARRTAVKEMMRRLSQRISTRRNILLKPQPFLARPFSTAHPSESDSDSFPSDSFSVPDSSFVAPVFHDDAIPSEIPIATQVPVLASAPALPSPEVVADSSSWIPPDYHPFNVLSQLIDQVHTTLDIPYWGSIVVCTMAARALLLPSALLQFQNAKRGSVAGERVKAINLKYGSPLNMSDAERKGYQEEVTKVYQETGFVPSRLLLLGIFPVPIFISFFFGLQRMAESHAGFAHGGAFFFENLAVPDPYFVLPVMNTLLFLAIGESNPELKKNPQMLFGMRALSLVIGGVATQFPAVRIIVVSSPLTLCLSLYISLSLSLFLSHPISLSQAIGVYWCANNLSTLLQINFMHHPAVLKRITPVIPKSSTAKK
jgi:membrane protein insertase Oxa1/YidC/SpoIIIJ